MKPNVVDMHVHGEVKPNIITVILLKMCFHAKRNIETTRHVGHGESQSSDDVVKHDLR